MIKDNFDVGLSMLEQRGFPQRRVLLDKLAATVQKANDYRRQADEAIKRPRDQRDENLRRTFTPVLTDSVNAALNVWFSALYRTAKADPKLARLASIKEIGWRMRDYSGAGARQCVHGDRVGDCDPARSSGRQCHDEIAGRAALAAVA